MATEPSSGDYVVVRHQPGRRVWQFVILLVLSVGGMLVGYMVGMAEGGFRFSDMAKTRSMLSEDLAEVREKYTETRRELVTLERGRRIDEQALADARQSIADLEGRIDALQADLTFYKNIMAPSEANKGLRIQRLELKAKPSARRYAYNLSLTQVDDDRRYIEGVVAVNVIGRQDGERRVIALRDLSEEVEELGVRFRYRYFQDIEGVMILPEGFEPLEIQVVAKAEGRDSAQSERTFNWQATVES